MYMAFFSSAITTLKTLVVAIGAGLGAVSYTHLDVYKRQVLRPAFQMAVDDDILVKNPFGFQLAGVLVNDAVTREAITKDQMRKFLKFVHDDVVYCLSLIHI